MKFVVSRTSNAGYPSKEVEISTLEELLDFVKSDNESVIIHKPGHGYPISNEWGLEIYDDYRE